MTNTIASNLNAGNTLNVENTGGTIRSTVNREGLNKPLSAVTNSEIAENVTAQADYYYAASSARDQIAKQLYGAAGAAARGYHPEQFDPAKERSITSGLNTIRSARPPEGIGKSISAGIFSGSVEDFNTFLGVESNRNVHETVNMYLDYQPFSKEFKEQHRISRDETGLDFKERWSKEVQREAQKDLLRQKWKGEDQVDSVFQSNNPWYNERKGAKENTREYYDLREQGLSPTEAAAKLTPKMTEKEYESALKGRWLYGVFMGADQTAADLAYKPAQNVWKFESEYRNYLNEINKPLDIDFSKAPTYIMWANPMQAEWNRQRYEASQAADAAKNNPSDTTAQLTALTGITNPQEQQQIAERYGYGSFRELASAHYDFKGHQASLPKFSDSDLNVYVGGGGNPYTANAKAA